MSQTVVYNGVSYVIPTTGEVGWGEETTAYLVALASGGVTHVGGLFPLTSDLQFTGSGIAAPYFRSGAPLPALSGTLRLATSEFIAWRNQSNTADLKLSVVNGALAFDGAPVGTAAPAAPLPIVHLWEYSNPGDEPIYSSPVGPVLLGPSNDIPCVVFSSGDWYVYALRLDGTLLWRTEGPAERYGRCQWASIGGNNFVFAPCHSGGITKHDRNGVQVGSYPSIYEDPRRSTGTITLVATISPGVYDITSDKSFWFTPNLFQRPSPADNAVFSVGPVVGSVVEVRAANRIRVSLPSLPVAGQVYTITPRYSSDVIFMHAGTLANEGGTLFLYLSGFDNCVRKLRADTLEEVWIKASLENVEPYPMLVGSRVYFSSIDNHVYALDIATGAVLWMTDCCPRQGEGLDSFLNFANGKIPVSSRDGRVYLLDAVTGALEQESTDTQAWQFDEINSSSIPVLQAGVYNYVTGGDAGTAWRFGPTLDTVWNNFLVPNSINSSSIIHDLQGNGTLHQIIGDMRGTLHFLRIPDGVKVGALYFKGGIEGVPYYGDIDGDGRPEMVVTTTDGHVHMYRFNLGGVYDDPGVYPGITRFTGGPTRY